MPQVHASAIITGEVELADDVVIGPSCVLTGPITIGAGTHFVGGAWLHGPLTMGERNVLYPFVCLGFAPQHAKFDPATPGQGLVIGDANTFREHVTIHRAFAGEAPTRVGSRNLFMTGSHVAHDCLIGNDCTFVSTSQLGGHAEVQDRVIVGGGTQVHQFVRLGRGSMLSGAMGISGDLPPWFMLTGNNLCGTINIIGLRRSGLGRDAIDDARWVYRTLYRRGLSARSALEALRERSASPFVAETIAFIEGAKRPICPGQARAIRSMVGAETRADA